MSEPQEHPRVPIPESYWVVPGRLLAGGYPGSLHEREARHKLRAFLEAGIRLFIDLTEEDELVHYDEWLAQEAAAKGIDVEYRRVPVRDFGIPTRQGVRDVFHLVDSAVRDERPAYIHCWGGIGRTGTMIGCWLRRDGCDLDTAIERLATLRRRTPEAWRQSPETDEQRRFISAWTDDTCDDEASRGADE